MQVYIKTENGQFTAQLKLPRALVLSMVLTVSGSVVEAIRCEMRIHELRAQIAQCQKQPAPAPVDTAGE